jgi:hypothetical protein
MGDWYPQKTANLFLKVKIHNSLLTLLHFFKICQDMYYNRLLVGFSCLTLRFYTTTVFQLYSGGQLAFEISGDPLATGFCEGLVDLQIQLPAGLVDFRQ